MLQFLPIAVIAFSHFLLIICETSVNVFLLIKLVGEIVYKHIFIKKFI